MPLPALTLAQLLQTCAPNIGERTMTAIVRVESGGNYLAIRDNDLNRSFSPVDAREATAWATQLLLKHHNIDLGIAQVNSANLARLGMTVQAAFDPCVNVQGGATILAADYAAASRQFGPGQFALRRAIGAYNSGSIFAGADYVNRILAAAGIRGDVDVQVPDLQAAGIGVSLPPVPPVPGAAAVPVRRVAAHHAAAKRKPSTAALASPILVPLTGAPGIQQQAAPQPTPAVAVRSTPAAGARPSPAAGASAAPASPAATPLPAAVLRAAGPYSVPVFVNFSSPGPAIVVHPPSASSTAAP
jgi:type IV secretion system protein VirB1